MYQALYRKYRPQTFSDVVGQKGVTDTLRAQIETEISPMVGGEQESQQLIDYLLGEYEEDTDKLWQSNIFGKSLYELVSEGVTAKIMRMPDDARQKLTKTLGRMINENTGGMICILL